MAIRNVVVEGDEILRKKCREVTEVNDRIRQTMEDMLETMRDSMGVGIAAPQVGIMRRMFIAEPEPGRVYYMINPVMLEQSGSQIDNEGCLSVPKLYANVKRPSRVVLKTQLLDGSALTAECGGLLARVLEHELDHLDGIVFVQKAEEEDYSKIENGVEKLIRKNGPRGFKVKRLV